MDIRDCDWYRISRRILDNYASKIGVIGLALYNAYVFYTQNKGNVFPSQKEIGERIGISVQTVNKYSKILEENGLIKIERRKGKGSIIYILQ